jgi:hypothetical protein
LLEVLGLIAVLNVRLRDYLPGATESIEVVYIERAEIDL